jgi:hypothetical protein
MKKIQVILLGLIISTFLLELFIYYLLMTGGYTSPLCL